MADLAPHNPTGRTVGQATTAVPTPSGGGGLPDLAFLLEERRTLFESMRLRSRRVGKGHMLARIAQIEGIIRPIAAENGLCGTCLEDLAGKAGPECRECEEVPF